MQVPVVLPDAEGLACECVEMDHPHRQVAVLVTSQHAGCPCPQCKTCSTRVHSRYGRILADLPWQGYQALLQWRSRKFFCDNPTCPQRIFTERLPLAAAPYARKTPRATTLLRNLGFACGGQSGARLARQLGLPVGPETLLRLVRNTPLPSLITPRVLGVDDWAFRRGRRHPGLRGRPRPANDTTRSGGGRSGTAGRGGETLRRAGPGCRARARSAMRRWR